MAITLDGTTGITVSGNVTAGNIIGTIAAGSNTISTTGNISASYFIGNGSLLTGIDATAIQNGTSNVRTFLNSNVSVSVAGTANVLVVTSTGANITGTLNATGNANVGNLGTAGLIVATGNVTGGNLVTAGQVSATGNVSGGNLNVTGNIVDTGALSLITGASGNVTLAPNGTNVVIATTTGANITGTINATGNANVGNLGTAGLIVATGNANVGNLGTAGLIVATGNVTGGNLVTAGRMTSATATVTGNANVGNIGVAAVVATGAISTTSTLSVTGNANVGNLGTAGLIVATGNITGGNLSGSLITGTLTTAAQPNVTSVGSLTSLTVTGNANVGNIGVAAVVATGAISTTSTLTTTGNAIIGGDLTVNGNVFSVNITDLNVEDPIIGLGRLANNQPLTSNDGKDRGEQLWYYLTSEKSAFIGFDNSANKLIAALDVSISNEVVTVNSYGTLVVGTLEAATVTATGNVTGGNLITAGVLSATGNANVGNLGTAGLIVATGNVTGGNLVTAGRMTSATATVTGNANVGNIGVAAVVATGNVTGGNLVTAGQVSATGNVSGGNLNVTGNIVDTGALTLITGASGNVSLAPNGTNTLVATTTGVVLTGTLTFASGGNVSAGNILNTNSNGVGNIGNSTTYFNTVFAKATSAQYADIAEMYVADAYYEPGTVLSFGGSHEVTGSTVACDARIAGVVSTNPSYLMNSTLSGDHVAAVALMGRVATFVQGPVAKGDMMVSAGNGMAMSCSAPQMGTVIGKALEDFSGTVGKIELVVGRL